MKKMLKIMAMLLVIATVVFAAGCAEKKTATENTTETSSVGNLTSGENNGTVPPVDNSTVPPVNNSTVPPVNNSTVPPE